MESSTGDGRVEERANRVALNTPGSCHKRDLRYELVEAARELVRARRQLDLGTRLDGAGGRSPEIQRLQERARLGRLEDAWWRLIVLVNTIEVAEYGEEGRS